MNLRGREWLGVAWPRIAVTLAVVAPYWRLFGLRSLLVTQDLLYSDIRDGELPPRALFGRLLRSGHWPSWHTGLCGGGSYATAAIDPLSLPTFGLLPAVPALDVFIVAVLLLIGHSTYSLARALSASRAGAALAAIAFAHSGFVVCQLKHLSIMATIAWVPLALLSLERALASRAEPRFEDPPDAPAVDRATPVRLRWLLAFAAIFGAQVLSGFPQSVYIVALAYGAWAAFRGVGLWRQDGVRRAAILLGAAALAVAIGAGIGAVALAPLSAVADTSDRAGGVTFEWASRLHYDVRNAIDLFVPYANGDISNLTYDGPGIFWEDYAYLGLATVLLALAGAARLRRRAHVAMLAGIVVVAYSMVLGPATPLFKIAFYALPGMSNFRFPTRFLVLVELGLALLGGLGLSDFERWLERRPASWAARAGWIAAGVVVVTFLDLMRAQPRQNAFVDARAWMEPPGTAAFLMQQQRLQQQGPFRIWTPYHREIHYQAFETARGWADLTPYFQMRDVIQPNSNLYWGLETADCYSGLATSSQTDVWGDHNRSGLLAYRAMRRAGAGLELAPGLPRVLRAFNVRYVLSPWPIDVPDLQLVDASTPVRVYEVSAVEPRIYLVGHAFSARSNQDAADRLLHKRFDPARDVILEGAPESLTSNAVRAQAPPGTLVVKKYGGDEVDVETSTTAQAFVVTSDAWSPAWRASVDGVETPIYRANILGRAVVVPPGEHKLVFRYVDLPVRRGALATAGAAGLWALLLAASLVHGRLRAGGVAS